MKPPNLHRLESVHSDKIKITLAVVSGSIRGSNKHNLEQESQKCLHCNTIELKSHPQLISVRYNPSLQLKKAFDPGSEPSSWSPQSRWSANRTSKPQIVGSKSESVFSHPIISILTRDIFDPSVTTTRHSLHDGDKFAFQQEISSELDQGWHGNGKWGDRAWVESRLHRLGKKFRAGWTKDILFSRCQ